MFLGLVRVDKFGQRKGTLVCGAEGYSKWEELISSYALGISTLAMQSSVKLVNIKNSELCGTGIPEKGKMQLLTQKAYKLFRRNVIKRMMSSSVVSLLRVKRNTSIIFSLL